MHGSDQDRKRADAPDVLWRVTTGSGVQFVCRVYIIGSQIEVRLTTEQDNLVCAKVVPSLDAASNVVRGWLQVVVADNGVSELISTSGVEIVH